MIITKPTIFNTIFTSLDLGLVGYMLDVTMESPQTSLKWLFIVNYSCSCAGKLILILQFSKYEIILRRVTLVSMIIPL